MGAFGGKTLCPLCGKPISGLSKTKLADTVICKECRGRCTQHLSLPESRSLSDISRNIQDNIRNKQLYSVFNPQTKIYNLFVDFSNRIWCVAEKKLVKCQEAYIFKFDDIAEYSVEEDGQTISKSGAGSAIAGGLLFGGAGMIVGGLAGRKAKETISKMSVIISVKNEWVSKVEIPIISTTIKKGSSTYNFAKNGLERIVEVLDRMSQG